MNNQEQLKRFIQVLKLDAHSLFDRIDKRRNDYVALFSAKRARQGLGLIFKSRYDTLSMKELMILGEDAQVAVHDFYALVEDCRWYLETTEDMPTQIIDHLLFWTNKLRKSLDQMDLYLDAELGIERRELETFHEEEPMDFNDLDSEPSLE